VGRGVLLTAAVLAVSLPIAAAGRQSPAPAAPTLGEIILLSNSTDAGASAALRAALASSDPAIRTAAGRVIAVVPHGELRPALVGALAREQDAAAGAEFVRDILHLSNGADLAFVDPQSKRLGARPSLVLAEWLARMQPAQFARRIPQFAELAGEAARGIGDLVAIAAAQHPAEADALHRQWMTVAPDGAWERTLATVSGPDGISGASAALLIDALSAPRPNVREETVWFVLNLVGRKQSVPEQAITAASQPREDATPWEALGRELLARRGKPPAAAPDRREFLLAQGPSHVPDLYKIQSAPQLTAGERDAVMSLAPLPRGLAQSGNPVSLTRTLEPLTADAIRATLAAAKCQPDASGIAVSSLTYAADGTPHHIQVDSANLSKECLAAWTALVRTAVAADDEPALPDRLQVVVLPLNETFLTCAAGDTEPAQPLPPAPARVGKIKQPAKLKDVKPFYPAQAQNRGIQGIVVVEAVIARTGCVSSARVLRTIPSLDSAALTAVSQWLFSPTLLDGVAVRVIMTVTVNFTLQ
jgi:TonB family protein